MDRKRKRGQGGEVQDRIEMYTENVEIDMEHVWLLLFFHGPGGYSRTHAFLMKKNSTYTHTHIRILVTVLTLRILC